MGVDDVRPPLLHQRLDRVGMGGNVAPLAQHRIACGGLAGGAVEVKAVDQFLQRTRCAVAMPGYAAHLPTPGHLRAQDGARAEGVATVQRQAVIQHMKNMGHSPYT